MNIIAIIQARLNSKRLRRKVLLDISGKTVLEHVIHRVHQSRMLGDVVVATTVDKADLAIVSLCAKLKISVYCGSEDDVLDRYYQAACLFKARHIIRITADCPLIDPQIIDDIVRLHLKSNADYTSNTIKETYPDGEDVEVIAFPALRKAWENADLSSEREHVTPYIKNNPEMFKLVNLECKKNLGQHRWTLDNMVDYEFVKAVYGHLSSRKPHFGMQDILHLLDQYPQLSKINAQIKRNEGYELSLKQDKSILGMISKKTKEVIDENH